MTTHWTSAWSNPVKIPIVWHKQRSLTPPNSMLKDTMRKEPRRTFLYTQTLLRGSRKEGCEEGWCWNEVGVRRKQASLVCCLVTNGENFAICITLKIPKVARVVVAHTCNSSTWEFEARTYAQQGTVSLIWNASAPMVRCKVGTELEAHRLSRLACRARNSKEAVSKQGRTVEVIDK